MKINIIDEIKKEIINRSNEFEEKTKDYNEVSNRVKKLIEDKYNKIMKANTIQELLGKRG